MLVYIKFIGWRSIGWKWPNSNERNKMRPKLLERHISVLDKASKYLTCQLSPNVIDRFNPIPIKIPAREF